MWLNTAIIGIESYTKLKYDMWLNTAIIGIESYTKLKYDMWLNTAIIGIESYTKLKYDMWFNIAYKDCTDSLTQSYYTEGTMHNTCIHSYTDIYLKPVKGY